MDISKTYSLKSLMVITLFMVLLMTLVDLGLYFILNQIAFSMTSEAAMKLVIPGANIEIFLQSLADVVKNINLLLDNFFVWIVPATSIFFLMSAILLWFIMKVSISPIFSSTISNSIDTNQSVVSKTTSSSNEHKDKKDHVEQRLEQERQRRLFLHFLSVLQREGRILDFFSEDLSLYDDEQIGAAVRSIQEDCKKSVEKYLSPQPVLTKEEGDVVEIPIGFDPDSIKLTGNVSGEPPFKGILRHKGWKAGKKEIPKLSDVLDSSIISPAEVEIE
ncbi:MAG: DUF2760 domain-containing protein [Desulfamplus sp.]|nr:DUF2760 domain-containing protein [Desulfamplus sp.]